MAIYKEDTACFITQFNSETGVLKENANTSRDLNVVPAWKQGVTGHNVTVGVIDNGRVMCIFLFICKYYFCSLFLGVEHNHTDLSSNYVRDKNIIATC